MVRAFPLVIVIAIAATSEAPSAEPLPAVCQQFIPLRDRVQKSGMVVQGAFKRKATPQEVCGLIKSFADDEAKMVMFVEDNAIPCGFPADTLEQLRASRERTAHAQTSVCSWPAALPTLGDPLRPTAPKKPAAILDDRLLPDRLERTRP